MNEIEKETFCRHARVWLAFLSSWTPTSCPYRQNSGSPCVEHACGYYEERKPTEHYRRKESILKEVSDD